MRRNSEPRFLSIDAGTTSMKAALCAPDGRVSAVDHQEYTLEMPAPALVELDPAVYWAACCRAVRNVVQRSGAAPEEIIALAISSQGETLLPVDEEGRPTREAIVWLDNRAVQEAQALGQRFGRQAIYHHTGQPDAVPTWPACKILWLREHEPEAFARAARFLLLEDYLLYRLTGRWVTEFTLQSSSLLMDIHTHRWWPPMLEAVGLSADRLPDILAPGQVVGPLSAEGARAVGLSRDTLVVTGALDQIAGAVGSGNIAPGIVSETTGGALAIVATLSAPRFDPQQRVPCHCHISADRYALLPWAQTAGMALRWFRDQFFVLERQVADGAGLDAYDLMTAEAARVPPGSDGLLALPHLEGAACPEFNPAARGVFFGATLRHTRAHFTRAILESVAYMLRKNLEIGRELGLAVNEVRSSGGGARSPLWLQIKADVLQTPFRAVQGEEGACLGVAALAATATGHFPNLTEAAARMARLGQQIVPAPDTRDVYAAGYRRYLELYDRLATMFR